MVSSFIKKQPEQTQETAQGQTTETNVQPEQGTTTTEQSVSADVVNNNQVEEVATNITEEEQEKINLERLNAYIEAKKQREQEQQVQVSPSVEMVNVD